MAVTVKRDNMRLIAIVLGEDNGKVGSTKIDKSSKDSIVGKTVVKSGNKNIKEVDAIVREDIDKISFLQTLGNTLKDLLIDELF